MAAEGWRQKGGQEEGEGYSLKGRGYSLGWEEGGYGGGKGGGDTGVSSQCRSFLFSLAPQLVMLGQPFIKLASPDM